MKNLLFTLTSRWFYFWKSSIKVRVIASSKENAHDMVSKRFPRFKIGSVKECDYGLSGTTHHITFYDETSRIALPEMSASEIKSLRSMFTEKRRGK